MSPSRTLPSSGGTVTETMYLTASFLQYSGYKQQKKESQQKVKGPCNRRPERQNKGKHFADWRSVQNFFWFARWIMGGSVTHHFGCLNCKLGCFDELPSFWIFDRWIG